MKMHAMENSKILTCMANFYGTDVRASHT